MSNYPPRPPPAPQYPTMAHFPEEPRRPLPAPPLPPRRPLSDFYGTPEHAPPQQSIYAQAHGDVNPAPAPASPGLPQQQQYGGYGVPISGGYSPPQQHANIYGRTSNPLYNQPPPVRKSSIPYGQSSAYSTTSPYGKSTSNQPSPYGQSSPYGKQQYGNIPSQAPSPYGKTASPSLIQQPYSQNIPPALYQSSPPAPDTSFPEPQYGQHESSYAQQVRPQSQHFGKTQSPPPMQSPPLRPPSQTATFNAQNDMGRQSVHGFNEGYKNQNPEPFANQSQYAYQDRPTSSGFDSVGYNTMDQQQRPSTTSPYGSQEYSNVPSQQYPGSSQHGYPSQGYPSLLPSQQAISHTNEPQRISSPPLPQASLIAPPKSPPFPSPSQYDQHATVASARVDELSQEHQQQPTTNPAQPHNQLLQTTPQNPEQMSFPQITSPPPEPTIPPIHPISPSPQPLPPQAIPQYTSPQHRKVPVTPTPSEPDAPIDEMVLFLEESIARYRDVLKREKELFEEGKSLHIPELLIGFMEGEVRIRRERYDIPEPAPVKVAEKETRQETTPAKTIDKEPLQNDLVSPPESVQNPITSEESKVPVKLHEAPDVPVIPVTEPQNPPATTFSATLSQVASYMGGPRQAPGPRKATTPKPASPPPASPTPEPQVSAPSETSAEPRVAEPTSKPFKEHPIPPIPKSDTLAAILTSLPTLASPDPILAPLRDRLTTLKDLSWIETDQLAFETREQKITTSLVQAAQSRQESHSARQSTLYATNSWSQADTESKTFDELEQKFKETELKQSTHRWRTEYCDPTYSKLQGIFENVSELHKEVVEMECENTEEQVLLLNDVQRTLMEVLGRLDVVTDELRRRQFELKVFRGHGMGDWEVINQFEKEKGEEDLVLKEQRREYRLDKVKLHSQCVKYLIDYTTETLSQRKQQVEEEVNKITGVLNESARSEELPKEGSMDAYPSEELIEQLKEAQLALQEIRQRTNALYGLLEQNELEVITEDDAPALNKACTSTDWTLAEQLNTAQRTKEKSLIDMSRELRDAEGAAFSDQLTSLITAHNGRKQARLAAIAFSSGAGEEGNAMAQLRQDQMRTQMVSNMLNTMPMSRMSVINNTGSSNTRYDYVV